MESTNMQLFETVDALNNHNKLITYEAKSYSYRRAGYF